MKKLSALVVILAACMAWSEPWYTAVAVDDSGHVCAGSIGTFLPWSEGDDITPTYSGGFLNCQNGHSEKFGYGLVDLVMVGTDSVLYPQIEFLNSDGISSVDSYDSALVLLGSATMSGGSSWNPAGSTNYEALRGILPVSADSILLADRNGLTANNFSMNKPRSVSGLPSPLSAGPVLSLARDFKGRLWAGVDSGVWVQSVAGDSWSYHAVGWPVRNIVPVNPGTVVMMSQQIALDGYRTYAGGNLDTFQIGCISSDTLRSAYSCLGMPSTSISPRVLFCFKEDLCYTANARVLAYRDHGVGIRQLTLNEIFDLALAPDGKLWAATGYGLYSIDTATFVATREYIGLDTPVVALPPVSRHAEWSYAQQGRRLTVQSPVTGVVELVALDGRCVQRVAVSRGTVQLTAPHAGLWLLRWTSAKGGAQVRRVVAR